jgi:hypothetical protein
VAMPPRIEAAFFHNFLSVLTSIEKGSFPIHYVPLNDECHPELVR